MNYNDLSELPQFDLLISQHAGSVGQAMKRFLRSGGVLLVAEGPEDASLAMKDPDYELVGTVKWGKDGAEIIPGVLPPVFITPPRSKGIQIPMERHFCFRKII